MACIGFSSRCTCVTPSASTAHGVGKGICDKGGFSRRPWMKPTCGRRCDTWSVTLSGPEWSDVPRITAGRARPHIAADDKTDCSIQYRAGVSNSRWWKTGRPGYSRATKWRKSRYSGEMSKKDCPAVLRDLFGNWGGRWGRLLEYRPQGRPKKIEGIKG